MGKDTDDMAYEAELRDLQLGLVRMQQAAIEAQDRILIIFEGRDAAGKDGTIQRIIEHLSVRATRVVALPKPSDREKTQWYFQRYVHFLPAAGEIVILNRSWYNRGGVEPVMGFCTPEEHKAFLKDVPVFEAMLVESGLKVVKLWLDVSRTEQARRLKERRDDPLKVLKSSPLDAAAQERWDAYSAARNEMLVASHRDDCPWTCVRGDHKKPARLNVIRHLLQALAPAGIAKAAGKPDEDVVFEFEKAAIKDGRLEP